MKKPPKPRCASCDNMECYSGKDCFKLIDQHRQLYEAEDIARFHKAASAIEARHYCKEPRLRELILFAKEMGFRKLGLAFCIGMAEEAKILGEVLSQDFNVISICCKVCGIPKHTYNLEQISPDKPHEVMCNPAGQAEILNQVGTELNIICGLCIGHDTIFTMTSKAPVTTFIVKDRVLGHNPAAALYVQYIRRTFLPDYKSPQEGPAGTKS